MQVETVSPIPKIRVRTLGDAPIRGSGQFVLYWMTMFRRAHDNFALDHAIGWCHHLRRPLLVLEPLMCAYPWASDRLHRFILEGMADTEADFAAAGIAYHPYVELQTGDLTGLLPELARHACVVVGDDHPTLHLPTMLRAAGRNLSVRLDLVDGNGLLPIRAAGRDYPSAYSFRRLLHKILPEHLERRPLATPLAAPGLRGAQLPAAVAARWPATDLASLSDAADLARLPIDHGVGPGRPRGGARAGAKVLETFITTRLARYPDARSHPDDAVASGLSPYLHFGHVGSHQVFSRLAAAQGWHRGLLAEQGRGQREGWWGMPGAGEAFLDELVTWRELGFGTCTYRPDDYADYGSLPEWARTTLAEHAQDPRPHLYDIEQLQAGRTHDPVWNAAQRQLRQEGELHNYMRMLWGKKILQWSPSPQAALAALLELNNRFAIDGRDPNSYSGIFWTLGRYDRPWPERPIFGKVRYMTSESTVKKLRVQRYLQRYSVDA